MTSLDWWGVGLMMGSALGSFVGIWAYRAMGGK